MIRPSGRVRNSLCAAAAILTLIALFTAPAWAIEVGVWDHFNDENLNGWRLGHIGASHPQVVKDIGPAGIGDHALWMSAGGAFQEARLLIMNEMVVGTGPWEGNWTSAGVRRISMDVRNPNEFPLFMRIGIAGPEGLFNGGAGDTWITDAVEVAPNPTGWQNVVIDVEPADFHPFGHSKGETPDIMAALADVTHVRILHNPQEDFIGEMIVGQFYLDNIETIGVLGDYNIDGVVNAADYVMWQSNPSRLMNEGSSPHVVDQQDYDFWRSRFGETSNPGAGSAAGGGLVLAAVPEPASWLSMAALVVLARATVRRRV